MARETGVDPEETEELITFMNDRTGRDQRYAFDCAKMKSELGLSSTVSLEEALSHTVRWYPDSRECVERAKSGEYRSRLEQYYITR